MIAILDYGIGNLKSCQNAFKVLEINHKVLEKPDAPSRYSGVVVPGVGHFGATIRKIREIGFDEMIFRILELGGFYFGICVGMQILFEKSEESPNERGLGLLPGNVVKLRASRLPNMQWGKLSASIDGEFRVLDNQWVYFVHSYECNFLGAGETMWGEYENRFLAGCKSGSILGVQFHPEKSGEVGLRFIKAVAELIEHPEEYKWN